MFVPGVTDPRHIRPRRPATSAPGDRLLAAGVRLDPWRLSLAAAAGRADCRGRAPAARRDPLHRRGDRRARRRAGPVPDLQFRLAGAGGAGRELGRRGRSPCRRWATTRRRSLAPWPTPAATLIVTVGGASVGDHDLVKPALAPPRPGADRRERRGAAGQADLVRDLGRRPPRAGPARQPGLGPGLRRAVPAAAPARPAGRVARAADRHGHGGDAPCRPTATASTGCARASSTDRTAPSVLCR